MKYRILGIKELWMKIWSILSATLLGYFISFNSFAQSETWSHWVLGVRTEALADGIAPRVFDEAFS
ncbi:MAG: hypothetical protein B7X00_01315 [Legionella sp. 21-45-4]|nr:MAG: hypothetical protein B7X00_01315 [Legionella sp. 21-45-4]